MGRTFQALGSVYDDFRAVTLGTSLSGRTSQSGHTWVVYQGTWTVQAGELPNTEGNVASSSSGGTFDRCGIDFGTADAAVEVTIHYQNPANPSGVMFRRDSFGYYYLRGGPGTALQIRAVANGGTFSTVATGTRALDDGDTIKIVGSGSSLTAYVNGVLDISTSDSTYGGTVHGMVQSFGDVGDVTFWAFNMHPVTNVWSVGMIR